MEDRLDDLAILHLPLSILAAKLVESAGNAPAWHCLQGRRFSFQPRPHENWQVALVLPQAS